MNVRSFRALSERGASYAEIAAACGVDWCTAKKYLRQPAGPPPAVTSRRDSLRWSASRAVAYFTDLGLIEGPARLLWRRSCLI